MLAELRIVDGSGETHLITVERARRGDPMVARAVLEIDLQTFTDATYAEPTAMAVAHHAAVYLLRRTGRPIGACVCLRDFDHPDEALVLSMGILPGWRGRGLGQALLGVVLDHLITEGIRAVVLHVGARNQRALKVYEDVGFFPVGEEGDADLLGERRLILRADLMARSALVGAK